MKGSPSMVMLFAAWNGVARGADGPQFRGPSRDGTPPETHLMERWPQGGPRVVWRTDRTGYGWWSVAVVKGSRPAKLVDHKEGLLG